MSEDQKKAILELARAIRAIAYDMPEASRSTLQQVAEATRQIELEFGL